MPILENGPVKIHYEEAGSGFPLLVQPGGGLEATIAGLDNHAFNPLEEFCDIHHVAALDLRNANNGSSEGPLDIERNWDAFTDDQLALADHLGFDKFLVIGFCIGGPMIWNLLKRAGDRVAGAVLVHPSGYISSHPNIFYENNMAGWAPPFCARREDVTMEMVSDFLNNMYTKRADFVFTVDRDFVPELSNVSLGSAGRYSGPPLCDGYGNRTLGAECAGQPLSMEGERPENPPRRAAHQDVPAGEYARKLGARRQESRIVGRFVLHDPKDAGVHHINAHHGGELQDADLAPTCADSVESFIFDTRRFQSSRPNRMMSASSSVSPSSGP